MLDCQDHVHQKVSTLNVYRAMPNNAQRQREELEDLRMLGELYSHEGEWLLEDRGDHESWTRKREKERNGD